MKYKAVIFDLFGTIIDIFSVQEYEKALTEMITILKAPHDEFVKVWRQTAGERGNGGFRTLEDNLEYICNELEMDFSKSQIKRACKVRMDYIAGAMTPRPEAIETLKQLKASGYKIGLISNCSPEPPLLWPRTPFAQFFDVTIFSCSAGLRKPDPRIYQLAAKKLAVKPEDCLYIGDGDGNELTGALQVGMYPVLIHNSRKDSINALHSEDYQDEDWNGVVITSLSEVINLL